MSSACSVGGAGTEFCEGESRRICISKLDSMEAPCGQNQRCRDRGNVECGCIPGTVDMGDGCKATSDCSAANGGCDELTTCKVEAGKRVCGDCPTGYAGDGESGCQPLLAGLTLSCPSDNLTITRDQRDYRLTVGLLCQQLTIQPQAPAGTSFKVNGMPLAAEGSWSSELLKLGESNVELSLISKTGFNTSYKLAIERTGSQTGFLKASNPDEDDRFGFRAAFSGDTLVVAAPWEDGGGSGVNPPDDNAVSNSGAVYVFVRKGKDWVQQAYLKADKPQSGAYFGTSVAIDGDTIAVGAGFVEPFLLSSSSSTPAGSAYVYARSGDTWSFVERVHASDEAPQNIFGWSVYFDKEELLVSAPFEASGAAESGAVYRYSRSDYRELGKIKVKDPLPTTGLGTGMTIDGNTLVIAAWSDSSTEMWAGSAYVFERENGGWAERQRMTVPSPQAGMGFSESVAVVGDVMAIGAANTPSSLTPARGEVYIYERKAAGWEQVRVLTAPVPRNADFFGSSLVLTPTTLAVGSNGDPSAAMGLQGDMRDTSKRFSGAVFLYARRGRELELSTYIKPFNPHVQDAFGADIGLASNILISAAAFESTAGKGINPMPNGNRTNSGALYVFE
jgi:hypothetical protein